MRRRNNYSSYSHTGFVGSKRKTGKFFTAWMVLVSSLIVTSCIFGVVKVNEVDYITATVTDKTVVVEDNSSKYLVFTDKEVFENEDTIVHGKWNSSDFQSKLTVGKTYKLKVYGWRVPFLSMYRNIISFEEVK